MNSCRPPGTYTVPFLWMKLGRKSNDLVPAPPGNYSASDGPTHLLHKDVIGPQVSGVPIGRIVGPQHLPRKEDRKQ